MTETDSTKRPLQMPEKFLPYLEKYRVYLMMKDMVRNIIIYLPKDHIKQMKIFANRHIHTSEASRMILLVEPGLNIGRYFSLSLMLITDFTSLTQHDEYEPGCVNIALMSEVTKALTLKEPVPQAGWVMFGNTVIKFI
ncbi:hypothetical protein HF086_000529 [Spodoptera exigua]|uniref:Uncharacterized protein n=1 Tax=Spodoptera exigua TaxID=7107 RepID=A0A922MNM4_SPOEX|nr:hypothetical protein HF086_000529 [Spodoptera exigua]